VPDEVAAATLPTFTRLASPVARSVAFHPHALRVRYNRRGRSCYKNSITSGRLTLPHLSQ
jgi:hypothetical protein